MIMPVNIILNEIVT